MRSFDPSPGVQLLLSAFGSVHSKHVSSLSFEELYRTAYQLTINRHNKSFLEALKAFWRDVFVVRAATVASSSQPVQNFLVEAKEAMTAIGHIGDVLMYLDKSSEIPVREIGKQMFRQALVQDSAVDVCMRAWMRECFLGMRPAETHELAEVVGVYTWSEAYDDVVMATHVDAVTDRTQLALQKLHDRCFVDFTRGAYDLLMEQRRLASAANLLPSGLVAVDGAIGLHAVSCHLDQLFRQGFSMLLKQPQLTEEHLTLLRQLYELGKRCSQALNHAADVQKEVIVQQVSQALETSSAAVVEQLIDLRRRHQAALAAFGHAHELALAVKQGFEAALSDSFVVQLLVHFVDERMRKADGPFTHGPDVIALYRHVADKDYFELLYRQQLAARLVQQTNFQVSEDETQFVSLLKCESGGVMTSRMETMVADVLSSSRFSSQTLDSNILAAKILTLGIWPFSAKHRAHDQAVSSLSALAPLLALRTRLLQEYQSRFQGRKLLFLYNIGGLEIRYTTAAQQQYILQLSPLQAMILLVLEAECVCTFARLRKLLLAAGGPEDEEHTQDASSDLHDRLQDAAAEGPAAELKRHLAGLFHSRRCALVLRNGTHAHGAQETSDDDQFTLDGRFQSAAKLVRVPLAVQRLKPARSSAAGAGGGSEMAAAALEEDRKHVLESVIVRVMKSRKKLDHNALVAEIIRLTAERFKPTVAAIKGRIENLIEREFIRRSDTDVNTYDYVA